jgi:hypothetical protein
VELILDNLERPLVAAGNPPFRVDRTSLSLADGYLLSRANGSVSARSMIDTAPLPVADVERSLIKGRDPSARPGQLRRCSGDT